MSNSKYLHSVSIQVRFNDVDIVGHVNNVMHHHYLDYARLQYFKKVFGCNIDWNDRLALVLASITSDFLVPIEMDDDVFVETKIWRLGNKSLQMSQRIISKKNAETVINTESSTVLVGFDQVEKYAVEIPQEWKEKIIAFEDNVTEK